MKMKRTLKILPDLALAAGSLALLVSTAQGATFVYTPGDLLLGFRQTGASADYIVDLGPASTYTNLSIGSHLTNANTRLLAEAVPSPDGLRWSVSGYIRPNISTATLWVTRARSDTNVQSTPWNNQSAFTEGSTGGQIAGIGYGANGNSGNHGTVNDTTNTYVSPYYDYTTQVESRQAPNDPRGTFQSTFQGDAETVTADDFDSDPGNISRADLYVLNSGSGSAQYLGYFDLKPSGQIVYTAGPSSTALPTQPVITGIVRQGNVTTVSFTTGSSGTYSLLFTNSVGLLTPASSWPVGGSTVSGNGSVQSLQDTTTATNRYYKVQAN